MINAYDFFPHGDSHHYWYNLTRWSDNVTGNLAHVNFKALFGKLDQEKRATLTNDIGAIDKARWMKSIICSMKAELFWEQIPEKLFSDDDYEGAKFVK